MNAVSTRSFDRIAVSSLFAEAVAPECGAAKSCHADVAFSKFHVIWRAPIQRCEDHTETNRHGEAATHAFDFCDRHVLIGSG
jgi:hypothetical protein